MAPDETGQGAEIPDGVPATPAQILGTTETASAQAEPIIAPVASGPSQVEQVQVAGAQESASSSDQTPQSPAQEAVPDASAPAASPDEGGAPDVPGGLPAPIPHDPSLVAHENADTAGTHGLPGEQLRTRSAQAIADEINGAQ